MSTIMEELEVRSTVDCGNNVITDSTQAPDTHTGTNTDTDTEADTAKHMQATPQNPPEIYTHLACILQ